MSGTYGLRFGNIDLSPAAQVGDVEYRVYGLKRGRVVPVTSVVESMLQDGAVERVDRHENRDQSIVIGVKSSDSAALAQAESDLFLEAQKRRNELAWTPSDGFGETTVFDVLWAVLDFADDADDWDLDELRGHRVYTLTIRALPFGRSESEVVDEGLSSGVTPTSSTISDGTSATNWTGATRTGSAATVTASGGTLQITPGSADTSSISTGTYYRNSVDFTYAPGSPVDFSATPYLQVDFKYISGGTVAGTGLRVFADGIEVQHLSAQVLTNGFYRASFLMTDPSVASLRLHVASTNYFPNGASVSIGYPFEIDNVIRTNQAPNASTTGRESMRSISVTGSARTEASLSVQHETSSLGDVLAYTSPTLSDAPLGYQPALRAYRTGGNAVTADTATVSGSRENLGSTTTFNVPAASLPKGTHLLMARVRSTSGTQTGNLTWKASTKIGSTLIGEQTVTSGFLSVTTAWTIVPLGVATLPPADVSDSSSGTVQFNGFTGVASLELDELWTFYLGDGSSLSWVACGSSSPNVGSSHNRLWLDSASVLSHQPAVWQGTLADRSDAFHAGNSASAWGVAQFVPPAMLIFVVTTNAVNPTVRLQHFARWHTHAQQAS